MRQKVENLPLCQGLRRRAKQTKVPAGLSESLGAHSARGVFAGRESRLEPQL